MRPFFWIFSCFLAVRDMDLNDRNISMWTNMHIRKHDVSFASWKLNHLRRHSTHVVMLRNPLAMRVSLSLLLITDEDSVVSHGGRSMGGNGGNRLRKRTRKIFFERKWKCDTIRDAILTCARKPTWVRLILINRATANSLWFRCVVRPLCRTATCRKFRGQFDPESGLVSMSSH